MKKTITFVLGSLFFLFFALSIYAQAPQKFYYQAVIRSDGELMSNKLVQLKLSILEGSENGTSVYVESHTTNTDAYGHINIAVGAGFVESGTFSEINWSSSAKYLKVEMNDGSGFKDMGASELLAVPFALHSNTGTPGPEGPQGPKGDKGDPGEDGAEGIGFFEADGNIIKYYDSNNYGKSFLVNTSSIDYSGSGMQDKMMFIPSKEGAFRVGIVSDSRWDLANIGVASFAFGSNTRASGDFSTAMGNSSVASGENSTALGTAAKASDKYSTAMGAYTEASGEYSTAMGWMSKASGHTSTAIGYNTLATGEYTTAMGYSTKGSGTYSTAMGYSTIALGGSSTAMGSHTEASSPNSTAMGYFTKASGQSSTAMGSGTVASGYASTAMGRNTKASGFISTAIGEATVASGSNSTAIGRYVTANGHGTIVLADASRTIESQRKSGNTDNRFYGIFSAGYALYTNSEATIGARMYGGQSSWSSISDSTMKENFLYVDGKETLKKIGGMKLGSWNYIGQNPEEFRHYGPMAQEFYELFGNDGIGTIGNDTTIATADIDGVIMIALQALVKENEGLTEELSEIKAENNEMRQELAELKATQAKTMALLEAIQATIDEEKTLQKFSKK